MGVYGIICCSRMATLKWVCMAFLIFTVATLSLVGMTAVIFGFVAHIEQKCLPINTDCQNGTQLEEGSSNGIKSIMAHAHTGIKRIMAHVHGGPDGSNGTEDSSIQINLQSTLRSPQNITNTTYI